MLKRLKVCVCLVVGLSLVRGYVARGAEPTMEDVLRRLSAVEGQVEVLQRMSGQPAPRETVDRATVTQIVQEEIAKARPANALDVMWKEGLRMQSADGAFSLHIGGRAQVDFAWMGADSDVEAAVGQMTDMTEFRRIYITLDGTIHENVSYKVEVDLAGAEVSLADVYLAVKNLVPFAKVQVGHFKEPFSLEELTSDNYATFMERGLPNVFAPSRNMGVQLSDTFCEDRGAWAAGLFVNTDSGGEGNIEEGAALTSRVTYLPQYEDGGRKLVHLGAAASIRSTDMAKYEARPEMHLAPKFLKSGDIMTDSVRLLGLEAAMVRGPFSLQGEVVRASLDADAAGDPTFTGCYVYGSYFLTGESRPYATSSGTFGRLKPKSNFDGKGNWGAWEVAARLSRLDMDDGDVEAGELSDLTLGLNWYLNPNARVMLNYVHAALDNAVEGDADGFMMRFQVDF